MIVDSSSVAVITPVFNGEPFLQECIDSVLNQTHRNIQYYIVDNCSTDRSLEIAELAAAADDRVTVLRSTDHVGVIQNWNRSLNFLDKQSKYIKFVHADDWLYPDCIARMVEVADSNENVALVSAYRLEENRVTLDKLPEDAPLIPCVEGFTMNGRVVARAILLERASVLGSPSSLLMRTEFLGDSSSFYDESYLHADKHAALLLLAEHDFGFVRQVLVYTRRHNESVSSMNNLLDTRRQENLHLLLAHGPKILSDKDYGFAWEQELQDYYDFLAGNVGAGHSAEFWKSHTDNLQRAGITLSRWQLIKKFLRRWFNPALSLKELLRTRDIVKEGNKSRSAAGSSR
ncbi:MAG: glycosyltransferase family 2 protein [Woeseiaceae bacterium]